MNLSIKTRIVIITIAIMFFSIGAIICTSSYAFNKAYNEALQSRLLAVGKSLKFQLDRLLHLGIEIENIVGFEEQCLDIVRKYEGIEHATVMDIAGRILFHNDPSMHGKRAGDVSLLTALKSGKDGIVVSSGDGFGRYHAVIPVFDSKGEHIAAVSVGFPANLITSKTRQMAAYSISVGAVFLFSAMGLLFLVLSFIVTRPLTKLMGVMQGIREEGTASERKVEIYSTDEIGQLGLAFNMMMDDLRKTTFSKKELEAEVQERTKQLVEAQEEVVRNEKLAVLGQLASSVGHELRNPLAVINNAVYYLKTIMPDADAAVRTYLDIIKNEVAASERIVSDLLDFSRSRMPQAMSVTVGELITRSMEKCAVPDNIEVRLDIPESLSPAAADLQQMAQVFQNLITNAAQAMPDGGVLTISADEDGYAGELRICVADTGRGITAENMGKLFQPLFTTKAKGMGLGLVVSKKLTEANMGRIRVDSGPGKGTKFMVVLPVAGKRS
jgi:signal transduction histidine kinase